LKLALEALSEAHYVVEHRQDVKKREQAITAIKAALEAKDEPVKLRRGDILRCIETDELCTVWATSTSGKTLVKWGSNDFTDYTAEQIGELFWLEPAQREQDGECKYCTDGCPACDVRKLSEQERFALKHRIAELEGAVIGLQAQRTWIGLTYEDMTKLQKDLYDAKGESVLPTTFAMAVEAKLKEKNT
jgi:hypothetical protein